MDLLAALGLAMVIEGLTLAVFAKSLPQLLAEMDKIGAEGLRRIGIICILSGAVLYLVIRGAGSG